MTLSKFTLSRLSRRGTRRAILVCLALLLAAPATAQQAARRATFIVPASAGGSTDIIARVLAEHMSRTMGLSIVVENVAGGGTTIASTRTASATPDGTTVLIA